MNEGEISVAVAEGTGVVLSAVMGVLVAALVTTGELDAVADQVSSGSSVTVSVTEATGIPVARGTYLVASGVAVKQHESSPRQKTTHAINGQYVFIKSIQALLKLVPTGFISFLRIMQM